MEKVKTTMVYKQNHSSFNGNANQKDKKWLRYQLQFLSNTIEQIAEKEGISVYEIMNDIKAYGLKDNIEITNDYFFSKYKFAIYFIQEPISRAIKIGYTTNLKERFSGIQCSNPNRLIILGIERGDRNKESEIHKQFEKYRIRGEWFKPSKEIMNYIDKINKNDGRCY